LLSPRTCPQSELPLFSFSAFQLFPLKSPFWLITAFLWTAGVLALALGPPGESTWLLKTFGDKLLHGFAFTLGCYAWGKAAEGIAPLRRFAPFAGAGIALLIGIAIEILQQYTPNRRSETADIIADLIGIIPAMILLLWRRPAREKTNNSAYHP
jgi:VanZ family protein